MEHVGDFGIYLKDIVPYTGGSVKLPGILLSLSPDEYCVDIFKQIWRDYYGVRLYTERHTQDIVLDKAYPEMNVQESELEQNSSKSIENISPMICTWISRQYPNISQTVSKQLDSEELSQSQINNRISECLIQAIQTALNVSETVEYVKQTNINIKVKSEFNSVLCNYYSSSGYYPYLRPCSKLKWRRRPRLNARTSNPSPQLFYHFNQG